MKTNSENDKSERPTAKKHDGIFSLALKSSKFASNWKADISLVISIEK